MKKLAALFFPLTGPAFLACSVFLASSVFLAGATLPASPVFAAPATAPVPAAVPLSFSDPAMEARARNLQRQLRCPVCQGESIDESGSSLAAELRQLVRRQMAQGRSDRQIEAYLKARYGDFILMKPPVQPNTYLLWLMPFLVLIGAGVVAILVISRARKDMAGSPPETH